MQQQSYPYGDYGGYYNTAAASAPQQPQAQPQATEAYGGYGGYQGYGTTTTQAGAPQATAAAPAPARAAAPAAANPYAYPSAPSAPPASSMTTTATATAAPAPNPYARQQPQPQSQPQPPAASPAYPPRTSQPADPYASMPSQQSAYPPAAAPYPPQPQSQSQQYAQGGPYQAAPQRATPPQPQTSTPTTQERPRTLDRRDRRAPLARPAPQRPVDLETAPSPPRDIHYTDIPNEYNTSACNAPLSTVDFVGLDDGNANPRFFRTTTASTPTEERLVKDSNIPFGAVLSPLCRPLHPREEIPIVRGRPPVRCHRCRGYISCHSRFIELGRRWECILCGVANTVEESYFANVDNKGRRQDRYERQELSLGSVEWDVDEYPEYSLRSDKGEVLTMRPLHHLFLLDLSSHAGNSFLPEYVAGIQKGLHDMAELTPRCKVGFIGYTSQLHFFNLRHPQMPQLDVPNVQDPFIPLPFGRLCWLEVGTEMELIESFLGRVVAIAGELHDGGNAFGAAVRAATLALSGQHGGRIVGCSHGLPNSGIGAIAPREYHKLYGTPKEKELFRPIEGFWTTTATECAKQQISIDLFMFPGSEYCELVTLSQLSHVTGGRVFLYSNYDPLIDNTKVHAQLQQVLTEEAGYAGILRVRCSTGLHVKKYRGHFFSQTASDMDLAGISGSSTFFVDFAHEGALQKNTYAYYQVALLYTTRDGHRRVRVQSYRCTVAPTLTSLFEGADLEAVFYGYLQEAVADTVNKGLEAARSNATDRLLKMLVTYRRFCTTKGSDQLLLMPSRLKLLPVYVLSLIKSDALVEGTTVRLDNREHCLYDLVTMPIHKILIYFYPSLFAVHTMVADLQCGTYNSITGKCVLPAHRQLILESIAKNGVYVLCDEQARLVYLWIGSEVSTAATECLFTDCPDARLVCRSGGPGEECFSERLRNVLYALMFRDDGMRRLIVLHEGERSEEAFFQQLKEEDNVAIKGQNYGKYLAQLHRRVRDAMY